MKICFVHYSSAPGGIEVLIPDIIRMMPGDEVSVFVIRPPSAGEADVYEDSGFDIRYGSANNLKAAWLLWRFARENRSSVFHAFNAGPYFMLAIRLAGIRKVVYSVRGTIHYRGIIEKIIRKAFWQLAAAREYRFMANSAYSSEVFTRYIPEIQSRIEVLYNPVYSTRLYISGSNRTDGLFRVIYAGRLTDGKNLFRWINIAAAIHSLRPDSVFFLYGEGPLREELADYIRSKGCESYIAIKGYVKDIAQAYNHADLMIYISEFESFGNAVVECILCGTPVIASDIPSFREIFINYPQFLVPIDERMESAIALKINELEALKSLAEKAAGEFRMRFSIEQHICGLKGVYSSFDRSNQKL